MAFWIAAASALAGCGSEPAGPPPPLAIADLPAPAGDNALAPQLAVGPRGEIVLSWIEPHGEGEGYALKHATLEGDAWSAPTEVARGEDWYASTMDMPSVQPITADVWAAHWLVQSQASQFAYDIAVAVSSDAGRTFGAPRLLNDDRTDAEHGFVTLFAWDNAVGAVWLDGRELAQFHEQDPTAPEIEIAPVGTNLRYARLGTDGSVLEQGLIDRLACDCCQTDVAVTARGPLVVYRDRVPGEIRDIAVRVHDGAAWSEAVGLGPDGWRIEGCPVNGPQLAVRGPAVVAAWFTAADDRARVRLARSANAGETFAAPIDVDDDGGAYGQVDVVLAADDSALVSWWRRNPSGGTQLVVRRVGGAAGDLGAPQTVAKSISSRPLDVPQMVTSGGRVVFAWTEIGEQSSVRTAIAPL